VGCQLLKEAGCTNLSLSCTIDEHNIDELESLLKLHEEYGFISINLNPLLDTENNRISIEYMQKASVRMLEYFERAREKGVYEDRIGRRIKAFTQGYIHMKDCGAYGNQLVISPDGKVGVCQGYVGSKQYFPGDVDNPYWDPFEDQVFLERRSNLHSSSLYFLPKNFLLSYFNVS
jgi:uncharacterized protein